ncbi:uncharacterized protein DUF3658 [Bacillus oleivorans]|uniref:Uncharacterized protein DUF3658 n=1 Tax=Bacillus oleivorans TaxID=1448271 RepID=A0A285CRK9_9BACI|nr:DUF1835 domain-containing protein [Bacillus oleivorans]SNX69603.1 uncharacterized protein DUF3658 [Bacillus oleivorans]
MLPIKTKINDRFIYFLIEPNVVLAYRIETHNYITVSDLRDMNKCETFEINDRDDFETFNHHERQGDEGKAFFVNQEDMNKMVEEINKHIQKYRHLKGLGNQSGAVHIVTSESAAGSLRVSLERPKTVIGFPESFSIGPLWKLHEKIGQSYRNEWLFENINYEQENYEYENKFINTLREIEDIANNVPIYIWYGNNADEQTGLRFFLYLLREKTNEIFLMNATELYERYGTNEEEQPYLHTSQMEPKNLRLFYENNNEKKPLSDRERMQFNQEWEKLSETKEVLRLWIDDEIKGVPEYHYDSLIIETIEKLHHKQGTKDYIKTGSVIGEILTQMDAYINIFFLEYRIRHLVYSGVLALKGIPKSMRHYSVKLR